MTADSIRRDVVPGFEPDDFLRIEFHGVLALSRDGRAAVTSKEWFDAAAHDYAGRSAVHRMDGDRATEVAELEPGASRPCWSPDGQVLYYVARRGGAVAICARDGEGTGAVRVVAELDAGVSEMCLSPSGSRIAVALTSKKPRREVGAYVPATAPRRRPVVNDHDVIRDECAGWSGPVEHSLAVVEVVTGAVRHFAVPDGTFAQETEEWYGSGVTWLGDTRLVLSLPTGYDSEHHLPQRNTDLHAVDVDSDEWEALTADPRVEQSPAVSPDCRQVAFLRQAGDPGEVVYQFEVCVLDLRTRHVQTIGEGLDLAFESVAWAGEGDALVVTYRDQGVRRLARLGLDGTLVDQADGVSSVRVASGGHVAFTRSTPATQAEPWIRQPNGVETRLTAASVWLRDRSLSVVSGLTYASAHPDRREIHAILAHPRDVADLSSLPIVVDLHGGPYNASEYRFNADREFFVGQGYVHIQPNYRGSVGYGSAFQRVSDRRHYPGWADDPDTPHEMSGDVVGVIDAIVERGLGDPGRVFLRGISAGALLASWVVSRTTAFRAAVANSWYTGEWGAPMYGWYQIRRYHQGPPWDPQHMPAYWRRSPVVLADRVKTPLLLMQGELDYFTPLVDAEKYYYALRAIGADVALAVFPGEIHGIEDSPIGTRDSRMMEVGWFREHDVATTGDGA